MKSKADLYIEMIGILGRRVADLENNCLELVNAEKILESEFEINQNKSIKYKNVQKKNVRTIINYLINEFPFLLIYSEEIGYVDDIEEFLQVLSYSEVLDRSIVAIKKIVEDLSKIIIESRKLTWEKLALTKPEYEIVCDKFYELLEEGNLCLEKTDTDLYRIIGDLYNKDEKNVKVLIYKYKHRYPELLDLILSRNKARAKLRLDHSSKSNKKSKQKRK